MDRFKLSIALGNDAMQYPEHITDALRRVAWDIDRGKTHGQVIDGNGNTVGNWEIN